MLHVYREAVSESARELVWALRDEDIDCQRLKRFPHPVRRRNPQNGDRLVCWGEAAPMQTGLLILNGAPIRTKYDDAVQLRQAGVPTVEVSRTRPTAQPVVDNAAVQVRLTAIQNATTSLNAAINNTQLLLRDRNWANFEASLPILARSRNSLTEAQNRPVPQPRPAQADGQWVGRTNSHVGGADLLNPTQNPDYYVKKIDLTREFRVHSFLGKSIRAGMKVRRTEDFTGTVHPWVRSWDGGWRISYSNDPNPVTNAHRELAHRAVAALGLQFGAVDLGEKADGSIIVLEVNRAPGIEAGTPPKYARAIMEWVNSPNGGN